LPSSLRSEALHTVVTAVTAKGGRESLVVQMVSSEKPVLTVPTITNVAQGRCVVMAATVGQYALLLFGPEVLLPPS